MLIKINTYSHFQALEYDRKLGAVEVLITASGWSETGLIFRLVLRGYSADFNTQEQQFITFYEVNLPVAAGWA